jgi:hypothetical protein
VYRWQGKQIPSAPVVWNLSTSHLSLPVAKTLPHGYTQMQEGLQTMAFPGRNVLGSVVMEKVKRIWGLTGSHHHPALPFAHWAHHPWPTSSSSVSPVYLKASPLTPLQQALVTLFLPLWLPCPCSLRTKVWAPSSSPHSRCQPCSPASACLPVSLLSLSCSPIFPINLGTCWCHQKPLDLTSFSSCSFSYVSFRENSAERLSSLLPQVPLLGSLFNFLQPAFHPHCFRKHLLMRLIQ